MNFAIAKTILNGRAMKKLKNQTFLHNASSCCIKLRFYETDIITFTKSYCIVNCNGNRSATTKKRINSFLPEGYFIFQKDKKWIWNYGKEFQDCDKIILSNRKGGN